MRVALTFDFEHPDHPCPPGGEAAILEALAAADVRATCFLQGRWTRAHPGTARRIAADGHLLGNHSHHHSPMNALTDQGFRADVREAEEAIRAVTGVDPWPWFRCPFGSGMADPRVLALLGELGYLHVGWDVDPLDWSEGKTREDLVAGVLDGIRGKGDSIVLLHGWPGVTAEALPILVDGLAAEGAELVAVDAVCAPGQRTVAR